VRNFIWRRWSRRVMEHSIRNLNIPFITALPIQKSSYTLQSQLIVFGLSYNIYKKVQCNRYKLVIRILLCGIPQVCTYYKEIIVKLFVQCVAEWRFLKFPEFYILYVAFCRVYTVCYKQINPPTENKKSRRTRRRCQTNQPRINPPPQHRNI